MPRLTSSWVKAGIVGEPAIAVAVASAAIARAIEPPGLADYGEVNRPGAGSAKGGHLQPGEFGRQEAGRPIVVVSAPSRSSRKLAWILRRVPRSGSSEKWITSGGCARQSLKGERASSKRKARRGDGSSSFSFVIWAKFACSPRAGVRKHRWLESVLVRWRQRRSAVRGRDRRRIQLWAVVGVAVLARGALGDAVAFPMRDPARPGRRRRLDADSRMRAALQSPGSTPTARSWTKSSRSPRMPAARIDRGYSRRSTPTARA